MTRLDRKSDAQANAEALARRSATFADEHARSWAVRFDRQSPPESLRELVHVLRKAYADEVPSRIHSRDTDAGGDPAWSPEFTRYLTGSDFATDSDDDTYRTPFRRCMSAMRRGDEKAQKRADLVAHVVYGNFTALEAAAMVGVPAWCAEEVAKRALSVYWSRLSDFRLDLAKTETAA